MIIRNIILSFFHYLPNSILRPSFVPLGPCLQIIPIFVTLWQLLNNKIYYKKLFVIVREKKIVHVMKCFCFTKWFSGQRILSSNLFSKLKADCWSTLLLSCHIEDFQVELKDMWKDSLNNNGKIFKCLFRKALKKIKMWSVYV